MITANQHTENNISGTSKVAIVTGSSKGIGRAIVLAFAKSAAYSGIVVNGGKKR